MHLVQLKQMFGTSKEQIVEPSNPLRGGIVFPLMESESVEKKKLHKLICLDVSVTSELSFFSFRSFRVSVKTFPTWSTLSIRYKDFPNVSTHHSLWFTFFLLFRIHAVLMSFISADLYFDLPHVTFSTREFS